MPKKDLTDEPPSSRLKAKLNRTARDQRWTSARRVLLAGLEILNKSFFNEFTVRLKTPAAPMVEALARRGILGGVPVSRFFPKEKSLESLLLLCATETNTDDDMAALAGALKELLK